MATKIDVYMDGIYKEYCKERAEEKGTSVSNFVLSLIRRHRKNYNRNERRRELIENKSKDGTGDSV